MDLIAIIIIVLFIGLPIFIIIGEALSKPYRERQNQIKTEENNQIERYKALNKKLEDNIKAICADHSIAKQQLKNIATHEIRDKFFLPAKKILDSEYNLDELYLSSANGVLNGIFKPYDTKLTMSHYEFSAIIRDNGILSHGSSYNTTLRSCSCEEFQKTKKPCKHILFLAYTFGVLQTNQENCKKYKDDIVEQVLKIAEEQKRLEYIIKTESDYIKDLYKEERKIKKKISELENTRELEQKLSYIEKIFPDITNIFDDGFQKESLELEANEDADHVQMFLSPEEYSSLSIIEKNQLALDRYIEGRKSKWQVGRDYEMYIGYLCEEEGYSVQYTGITKNLEDMGRDLILEGNGQSFIIQCKNWSQEKAIHEKHIFQLYGSTVQYNIENHAHAKPIFISTTKLSPMAEQVAQELNVKTKTVQLGSFPRIKCNINQTTMEKIYHLPFDQQYDTTVIDKSKGELYAFTIAEAESLGFRRAMHHTNK